VFTIAPLTELLVRDLQKRGIAQLPLILAVSYRIYEGYVWLTDYLPSNRTFLRLLVLPWLPARG
jgi:hypothetical protein